MGSKPEMISSLPKEWVEGVDEEFFVNDQVEKEITIIGAKGTTDPTLSVSNGSMVVMAAKKSGVARIED